MEYDFQRGNNATLAAKSKHKELVIELFLAKHLQQPRTKSALVNQRFIKKRFLNIGLDFFQKGCLSKMFYIQE